MNLLLQRLRTVNMETTFYPNAMRNNHDIGFRPTNKPLQELIDAMNDVWDGFSLCQFPCFVLVWHGRVKVNCWPFRLLFQKCFM